MKLEERKPHSIEYFKEFRDYWWNDDYLELLAGRLNLNKCRFMTDVGCGRGYLGFKFAQYLSENAISCGFDLENLHIEEANKRLAYFENEKNIQFNFKVGNAYNLPLENDISEITICQTLLVHLDKPQKVINEMKRITKKNSYVVAVEPNSIVNNLIFDNVLEPDIKKNLFFIETRMIIEKGKQLAGDGQASIGDKLPNMFLKAGLEDVNVWIADKANCILPPYNSDEKIARVEEYLSWTNRARLESEYKFQLNYYILGGGKKTTFDEYWDMFLEYCKKIEDRLLKESYVFSGGGVLYIVAGRV